MPEFSPPRDRLNEVTSQTQQLCLEIYFSRLMTPRFVGIAIWGNIFGSQGLIQPAYNIFKLKVRTLQ